MSEENKISQVSVSPIQISQTEITRNDNISITQQQQQQQQRAAANNNSTSSMIYSPSTPQLSKNDRIDGNSLSSPSSGNSSIGHSPYPDNSITTSPAPTSPSGRPRPDSMTLPSPSPEPSPLHAPIRPSKPISPTSALDVDTGKLPNITSPDPVASHSVNTSVVTKSRTISWRKKLVLCLVGLPARGKSYIAYKVVGYLRWRGLRAQLFNVGKHRRSHVQSSQDATFFDANNVEAQNQRDQLAYEVLESMLDWLSDGGDVSVFDATNTTNHRRWEVVHHCQNRSPFLRVIFIESICDDEQVLQSNYLSKCQNSPDYSSMPLEEALKDLKKRIANYEKVYEPVNDDHLSYLKLINLNSKVIANKIHGSLGHLISAYLMSIHIQPRPIYLVRTGKCEGEERIPYSQRLSDIGTTDEPFHMPFTINMAANLTSRGRAFSKRLAQFLQERSLEYWNSMKQGNNLDPLANFAAMMGIQLGIGSNSQSSSSTTATANNSISPSSNSSPLINSSNKIENEANCLASDFSLNNPPPPPQPDSLLRSSSRGVELPLIVYTSTLPRALQTVENISSHVLLCEQTSALNMMDTGVCHGLSLEEIKRKFPSELEKWHREKYYYRFPGGESQADKARSLESLVMELERHFFPVLIVSHASTLQVLYGYFLGASKSINEYYSLHVPQHFVIELTPHQYGWTERRWDLRSEEEIIEDKQMRQERLERLELQGKINFNHIHLNLTGNESRRGSDKFMKAEVDEMLENKLKPRNGNMQGEQPELINHAAGFY